MAKDRSGYQPGLLDDLDPDQAPVVDGGIFSDLDPAARPARDAAYRQQAAADKAAADASFYGFDEDKTGTRIAKGGVLRGALAVAGTVGTLAGNLLPGQAGDDAYAAGKSAFEEADAVGAGQRAGRDAMAAKGTPSVYSPRVEENITGATSGLVQAVPAMAVGPWTSILSGAATAGTQAEHEADAAGITGIDKAAYAGSIAAVNGAVAGVFQKFGLGGKEAESVGAKLIDQSFTRALVNAGVQTGAEGVQNVLIAAGTKVARKLAGTDATPNDWSRELEDAAVQGLIVSGAMHAATLGANAVDMGREALNERAGVRDATAMVGESLGNPADAVGPGTAYGEPLEPVGQPAGLFHDLDPAQEPAAPPQPLAAARPGSRVPVDAGVPLGDIGALRAREAASARGELDAAPPAAGEETRLDRPAVARVPIPSESADGANVPGEAASAQPGEAGAAGGEAGTGVLPPVRLGRRGDAPPVVRPADDGRVAVPPVPPERAPAERSGPAPAVAGRVEDQAPIEALGQAAKREEPAPRTAFDDHRAYPTVKPGDQVDGLTVGERIANRGSIGASLGEDYRVLPGVREFRMDQFDGPQSVHYAADDFRRSKELAQRIRESGRIDPLIIAVDKDGPYILEGAHRYVALHELGKKSFPALVVEDTSSTHGVDLAGKRPDVERPLGELKQEVDDAVRGGRARGDEGVARDDATAGERVVVPPRAPAEGGPEGAARLEPGRGDNAADRVPVDGAVRPDAAPEPEAADAAMHPEDRAILDELNAKKGATPAARIAPAPIEGAKPLKHQAAILDLSQGVGRSIFQGRKHVSEGRGVLGTYFPGPVKTTIRYHGDLDVTAHEVGHMLDDRFGLVGKWAARRQRSPFDAELIPNFSAHGSKGASLAYTRAEGVAEYLRAWMVNPAAAEKAAPQFTAHMKAEIPAKILGKIRAFGDNIRRFAGTSAIEGISANVQHFGEHPEVRRALTQKLRDLFARKGMVFETNALDRLRSEVQDQLWPVMKAVAAAAEFRGLDPAIGSPKGLKPENDPRIAIRLLSGIRDGMQLMLEKGPLDLDGKGRTPGGVGWLWEPARPGRVHEDLTLAENHAIAQRVVWEAKKIDEETAAKVAEMQQAGASQKAIANVLISARARKARIAGIGGGVFADDVMAARAVREVAAMDEPTRRTVDELNARMRQWSRANLDHLVDMGMLTKKSRRDILAANPYYVDFRRVFPEAVNDEGPKRTGVGNPVAVRKGSTRQIEDPYVSLLAMTERVHRMAARNAAVRAFADLVDETRGMYQGDATPFAEIGRKVPAEERRDGDGAIAVKRVEKSTDADGKTTEELVTEHWQFDKEVQRALERWSTVNDDGAFMKALMVPAKIARWGVTHGPSFILRNIMRDAVSRGVLSRTGSTPWDQFSRVKPDDYDRFRAFGGGQAGHYLNDKVNYHRELSKRLRQLAGDRKSVLTLPWRAAKGAYDFYADRLAQGSELIGRMAEFRRAYKHATEKLGYDDRNANMYAAYQSRDLLDYAVAGHFTRQVAKFIPFFNANIQGVARAVRGAAESPKSFLVKWGAYVVAPTLATYAWNTRDEESKKAYQQLPAWRRDMFWNIHLGPDFWLSLPKPFELGAMASGFERALDYARGDKHAVDGYGTSLAQALIPVGQDTMAGPMAPALELMTNKDFFTGRDIVPTYEQGKAPALRAGAEHASRIGKGIAPLLGADPRQVDQFIRSSLGNVGSLALQTGDIGRGDDKDSASAWARTLSGISAADPSWNARDVDATMTEAVRRGEEQSKPVMRLRGMLKLAQATKDPAEREKLKTEAVAYATALRKAYDDTPFDNPPPTPTKKDLRGALDKAQITGKPEDRAAAIDIAKTKTAALIAETKASGTAKALEKTRLMLATIDARKDLTDPQRAALRRALQKRLAELTK